MENNIYLAIQDRKILDICDTQEDAEKYIAMEQQRDLLKLALKKRLVKRILKGKKAIPLTSYAVAKVTFCKTFNTEDEL